MLLRLFLSSFFLLSCKSDETDLIYLFTLGPVETGLVYLFTHVPLDKFSRSLVRPNRSPTRVRTALLHVSCLIYAVFSILCTSIIFHTLYIQYM